MSSAASLASRAAFNRAHFSSKKLASPSCTIFGSAGDLAPWIAHALKLGSVEEETDDEEELAYVRDESGTQLCNFRLNLAAECLPEGQGSDG